VILQTGIAGIQIRGFCIAPIPSLAMLEVSVTDNSLRTPSLHDCSQPHLLRIIGDVWSKPIYRSTKVAIGTSNNIWDSHPWPKRSENLGQASMIHLPAKDLIFLSLLMSFSGYN
jgi:hypothetical protein